MKTISVIVAIVLASVFAMQAQPCVEAAKETKPILTDDARAELEKKFADARAEALDKNKGSDLDSLIWYARRAAYLGNYKDAIGTFSFALLKWPEEARLLRHRGHRYISVRCFDDAIADLDAAAKLVKGKPDEVEPDGMPNAKNIPTSTLQSNIWYHLGLAYYLKGDFKNALKAYKEAEKVSKNNDMRVATAYWHYMTLRRLNKPNDAKKMIDQFAGEIEVIENTDYLKLIRLNRGEAKPEDLLSTIQGDANTLSSASLGYGIGNYFLYNGDKAKAVTIFRKITEGSQWASFGYIAAEAELSRP